jgi:hypothetical protein
MAIEGMKGFSMPCDLPNYGLKSQVIAEEIEQDHY